MRILIYGLNFAPELTGIGRFTGDMAAWLADHGHEVRAVVAPPYYPLWRTAEGYRGPFWRSQKLGSVDVVRCPLYVPRRATGVRRLMHLGSFALTSGMPALWRAFRWRPDVVFTVEPTAAILPAAWIAARLGGALAWLHVQDFELDAALDLGLLPSVLKRPARAIERSFLRRFDTVSTISSTMLDGLTEKDVDQNRAVLFPNWVDTDAITPDTNGSTFRREAGARRGDVVVLYAGNIGQKQGIELLVSTAVAVEAARRRADPKVRFVIAGAGAGRPALEQASSAAKRESAQITLLPLQPENRLASMLAAADIHVLPQRAEAADIVMPSKLGGMLASGRPIVASAAPNTQIAQAVEGRGLAVAPEDAKAMAQAILTLSRDPDKRARLGAAARASAIADWNRDMVLGRFESELVARLAAKRGSR